MAETTETTQHTAGRRKILIGKVVSTKMAKTIVDGWAPDGLGAEK